MAGIPEIIGESQLGTLNPVRENTEGEIADRPVWRPYPLAVPTSGMIASPLWLRLHDFSGEGERAPPELRRWGQAGGGRDPRCVPRNKTLSR